jgi:transcriptional regulator with XRE-family HTH domain
MLDHRPLSKKFGLNLKKVRLEMGLSQLEVALATNLNESYISRIETGKARVTMALIEQLCRGLNIRSFDIVRGEF